MLAWSKDHNVTPTQIMSGTACSGCDSTYYTDSQGKQHLLYAKCTNRMGSRFTQANFLEPIYKYKESLADTGGWSVIDWHFEKCFETWDCGEYCSLDEVPPVCLKYYTKNWGLYVPDTQGACAYGSGGSNSPPTTEPVTPPGSAPGYQNPTPYPGMNRQPMDRDTTWEPVY